MKNSNFFVWVLGIFLIIFFALIFANIIEKDLTGKAVAGDACIEEGVLEGNFYCSIDGIWKVLIAEGREGCLNDYECANGECSDGICQSRFAPIKNQTSLLQNIWLLIQGKCIPESEKCEGQLHFTCGTLGAWEPSGGVLVDGKCGYSSGGDGGDGGDGSSGSIDLIIYSPGNITYNTKSIRLEVEDKNDKAQYFNYILNNGAKTSFISPITIGANEGGNTLEVLAKKTTNGIETKKSVSFAVVLSNPIVYCGDLNCDFGEDSDNCLSDCEQPSICNDNGECDYSLGENSNNCPGDCEPVQGGYGWIFWVLIAILIIAILVVLFFIYKHYKTKKERKEMFSMKKFEGPKPLMPTTIGKLIEKKELPSIIGPLPKIDTELKPIKQPEKKPEIKPQPQKKDASIFRPVIRSDINFYKKPIVPQQQKPLINPLIIPQQRLIPGSLIKPEENIIYRGGRVVPGEAARANIRNSLRKISEFTISKPETISRPRSGLINIKTKTTKPKSIKHKTTKPKTNKAKASSKTVKTITHTTKTIKISKPKSNKTSKTKSSTKKGK
ncbi:MAG: hypothetical protein AABX30_03625 [Nanoarchaeota archaeon]